MSEQTNKEPASAILNNIKQFADSHFKSPHTVEEAMLVDTLIKDIERYGKALVSEKLTALKEHITDDILISCNGFEKDEKSGLCRICGYKKFETVHDLSEVIKKIEELTYATNN